jgi:hypothetical protein
VNVSFGAVAQVSNADYVEELEGQFYNVGASGEVGGGVTGSTFSGRTCGKYVAGGTFGVSAGGGFEVHATDTTTKTLWSFGATPPACPDMSPVASRTGGPGKSQVLDEWVGSQPWH